MIYVGIDHHKKNSHVVALNDDGEVLFDRAVPSKLSAMEEVKASLPKNESICSVLEAGWNWGKMHDALESIGMNPCLANPRKVGLIAESFVKTDRIDAHVLARMLKADMIPQVHIPSKSRRSQRNLMRRRLWLVRLQTAVKNRIHSLLDRNHIEAPGVSDSFGTQGRRWMEGLELEGPDAKILPDELILIDEVKKHVAATQRWVAKELKDDPLRVVMSSFPGFGPVFAAVVALEVDTIDRFPSAAKLCAYAGLAGATWSSGDRVRRGGLIPISNRFLRYTYIEATWTAVRISPYFGAYYGRLVPRIGKQKAIVATARKLCEISYTCMRKGKPYEERPYRFRSDRLRRVLA